VNKRSLEQPEYSILLFVIAFGLFFGTFAIVPAGNFLWAFLHLFGSWLLIIGLLYFQAKARSRRPRDFEPPEVPELPEPRAEDV